MPLSAAEKLEKKQRLEEKREARRLAKEKKEKEKAAAAAAGGVSTAKNATGNGESSTAEKKEKCYMFELSDDTLNHILWYTSAKELGALTLTCRHFSTMLRESRPALLMSRLHRPDEKITGAVGHVNMCADRTEASLLVEQSFGGGDTNRIRAKGKAGKEFASEFVSYSRFLEEAVCGYATQYYGGRKPTMLPPFVNGRFVSVSPEHSLCRVGGGEKSGAGGSGVASWGVGKRGQLGHGKRTDEKLPRMLLGGIGYGIRIVQVSAGGGIVRVAHSLLLTSTGRVLSFGTGQYGALGHGFSAGKQLPDVLRPQYIEALSSVRCVCVAAGELHSAAVSVDGDVYTWGDGFCGQLGHGDKRPQVAPVQVTSGGLDDECVSHVSCGARHTLAVTEDGEVFSWGLGHFGVLGRSFTPYDHDPETALMQMVVDEEDANPAIPAAAAAAPEHPVENQVLDGQTEQAENGAQESTWNFDSLMEHLDMIANLSLTDSSDQCIPKIIDSMKGVKVIGVSAGHRHSLLLDDRGWMYSTGSGISGCLGHGDHESHMFPMKIKAFDNENVKVMRMSAGVDISMAVTTTGDVYAWGKTDGGRIGLGIQSARVTLPRRVRVTSDGSKIKAVDVECGYVHSMIVGLNGTIFQCGGVGVDGEADGQSPGDLTGEPVQISDFNIWHRIPEPKEHIKKEKWKKYGKYEVKGRQKMLEVDTGALK